jgi:hypothetical protein
MIMYRFLKSIYEKTTSLPARFEWNFEFSPVLSRYTISCLLTNWFKSYFRTYGYAVEPSPLKYSQHVSLLNNKSLTLYTNF